MSDAERIIPVLAYEDIEAAHRFLVQAFRFEPGDLSRDGDGAATHGEVAIGGSRIWLHRVTQEHGLASPRSLGASTGGLVIYVDDVDAHHEYALEHGATVDRPPADMPYGHREYGTRDPEGGQWYFATRLNTTSHGSPSADDG